MSRATSTSLHPPCPITLRCTQVADCATLDSLYHNEGCTMQVGEG